MEDMRKPLFDWNSFGRTLVTTVAPAGSFASLSERVHSMKPGGFNVEEVDPETDDGEDDDGEAIEIAAVETETKKAEAEAKRKAKREEARKRAEEEATQETREESDEDDDRAKAGQEGWGGQVDGKEADGAGAESEQA